MLWSSLELPIVILSGLGRVVVTIKKTDLKSPRATNKQATFVWFSRVQELAFHAIPLGSIIYYNNLMLNSWTSMNIAVLILFLVNAV